MSKLPFTWQIYEFLNPDLKQINIKGRTKLTHHWLKYGRKGGRKYHVRHVTPDFDWLRYREMNPDLLAVLRGRIQYELHWLKSGRKAGRAYKDFVGSNSKGPPLSQIVNEALAAKEEGTKVYTLFISCCFIPYIDACALTVAKRILSWGGHIDVISNHMQRKIDARLSDITKGLITNQMILNQKFTGFGTGLEMESFSKSGLDLAASWIKKNQKPYDKLYSRALLPASHTAAIVYKTCHPEVRWTADFSDPILFDMENRVRISLLSAEWYNKFILVNLVKKGLLDSLTDKNNYNGYFWMELMAYILADELIFTNPNHMEFMVRRFPYPFDPETNKRVLMEIRGKCKAVPHPILPPEFYRLGKKLELPKNGKKKIGYFGTFYAKRNFNDLMQLLGLCKGLFEAHIYTQNVPTRLKKICKKRNDIFVSDFMGYFDFLTAIDSFDAVLVIDALVDHILGINPYLPSKFSDYMGATAPIWLMTEKGSYLDELIFVDNMYQGHRVYRSRIGDIKGHMRVLCQIISKS